MATSEYWRKACHIFAGLSISFAYLWLPKDIFLCLFFPMAVAYIIVDLARFKIKWLERIYLLAAKTFLRDEEYSRPTTGFYFFVGSALTIILFPKQIAIGTLIVLALSDPLAALIGQRYGRHRIWNKTIEGSMAFFISAWLILTLYFGGEPFKHLIPAFAGTLVELAPCPIDDNLSIPLVIGLSYVIFF